MDPFTKAAMAATRVQDVDAETAGLMFISLLNNEPMEMPKQAAPKSVPRTKREDLDLGEHWMEPTPAPRTAEDLKKDTEKEAGIRGAIGDVAKSLVGRGYRTVGHVPVIVTRDATGRVANRMLHTAAGITPKARMTNMPTNVEEAQRIARLLGADITTNPQTGAVLMSRWAKPKGKILPRRTATMMKKLDPKAIKGQKQVGGTLQGTPIVDNTATVAATKQQMKYPWMMTAAEKAEKGIDWAQKNPGLAGAYGVGGLLAARGLFGGRRRRGGGGGPIIIQS